MVYLLSRVQLVGIGDRATRNDVPRVNRPGYIRASRKRGAVHGLFRARVSPVVEHTSRTLLQTSKRGARLPTPLTGDNHSAAQDGRRVGLRQQETAVPSLGGCRHCGLVLEDRSRMYCDECYSELRVAQAKRLGQIGPARLAQLRAEGRDPVRTLDARRRIGASNRIRQRAIQAWEAEHGRAPDSEVFAREILPGLQTVTITRMAAVTGLSIQYCSKIRSGQHSPHPMHWSALRALTAEK